MSARAHTVAAFVVTALAVAVVAAPASADDYCVGQAREACVGTFDTVQHALSAAETTVGPDRVLIGPGDFVVPTGGLAYNDLGRVEIRGTSAQATRLLQANSTPSQEYALQVSDSASGQSVVADLTIVVGQQRLGGPDPDHNAALKMGENARVEDVAIRRAAGAESVVGMVLGGRVTVSRAAIDLGEGSNSAVGVLAKDAGSLVTLEDSTIRAGTGVQAFLAGSVEVHRATIESLFDCLLDNGSPMTADDVVCRLEPNPIAAGRAFELTARGGGVPAELTIRNATVTGGNPQSYSGYALASPDGPVTLRISDSILRNDGHGFGRQALGASAASIVGERNDVNPAAAPGDELGPGSISETGSRTDDPRFLGDPALGDLRLRHDSPLIDAGGPDRTTGTDRTGADRVRDGDGDGSARVDLGAFEYQRRPPAVTAATASPARNAVGIPFAFSAAASDPDGDPVAFHWAWDDGGTAGGASVTHPFAAPGPHGGTATATDATGLSAVEATSVDVTPGPTAPVVPPDTVAPRFTILRRGLRLSRTGTIPIRVICSAAEREPCAGTLTLASTKKVAPRRRVLKLGQAKFTAAPGKTVIVRVKVSRRTAAIARRLRKVNVTAVGVARDSAGNEASFKRTATLITAKPKRKKRGSR